MVSPRPVSVVRVKDAYLVLYADRQPHQRYSAAQFDARDHSLVDVIAWVRSQSHLSLVELEE